MTVTFEGGVLNSLAPWAPTGSDLQKYTSALATMFETVFGLVADQGSPDEPASYTAGWSTLLDPTACPAEFLPLCGAFIGSVVPPGTGAATARAQILAEQNFNRGTGFAGTYTIANGAAGGAIVLAAQRFLSGTQQATLLERTAADGTTPDPYHAVLIVLTSQVVDLAQLTTAVFAAKPAGIQLTIVETASWTITSMEASQTTLSALEAAFPTISNLETDVV